jgi:hypothetical protein
MQGVWHLYMGATQGVIPLANAEARGTACLRPFKTSASIELRPYTFRYGGVHDLDLTHVGVELAFLRQWDRFAGGRLLFATDSPSGDSIWLAMSSAQSMPLVLRGTLQRDTIQGVWSYPEVRGEFMATRMSGATCPLPWPARALQFGDTLPN